MGKIKMRKWGAVVAAFFVVPLFACAQRPPSGQDIISNTPQDVVPAITNPLPIGVYCTRFFIVGEGNRYVCTNAMDPKDSFTVSNAANADAEMKKMYARIAAMKRGEVLAGNPQTKDIKIITPLFNSRPVRAYADAASLILGDASGALAEAREFLAEERVLAALLGMTPIARALERNVDAAIAAVDDIGGISPRLSVAAQKKAALEALKELEKSLRGALESVDKAIEKMKGYKKTLEKLIRTEELAKTNIALEANRENLRSLEAAIAVAEAMRRAIAQEAANIRMFRALHAD